VGIFNIKPYDWGDYITVDDVARSLQQELPFVDVEEALFRKFKIEFFYPHTGAQINFKAFITQYNESFTSEYDVVPVYGRMDPTTHFQRTGRTLSLAWTAPAASVEEAYLNLQNASKLAKMMYPVYGANKGKDELFGTFQDATEMKAPPRIILRFSNLIKRGGLPGEDNSGIAAGGLHGILRSYNWQPVLEDGFFDGIPAPEFNQVALLPKTMAFSVSYLVTHRDTNGWSENGEWLGQQEFPWLPGEAPEPQSTFSNEAGSDASACEHLVGPSDTTQAGLDRCSEQIEELLAADTEAGIYGGEIDI